MNHKIISQIADAPWSKVFAFALVMAAVYYFGLYDDGSEIRARYDQAVIRKNEVAQSLASTKKARQEADLFKQKLDRLEKQVMGLKVLMPETMGSAELTQIVTNQALSANARLKEIDPKQGAEKAEFYEAVRARIALEGSFAQILTFLSNLSKVPKLMTFDDVELKVIDAGDLERPRLSFTGNLVGYRYVPEPTKGANGAAGGAANAPK